MSEKDNIPMEKMNDIRPEPNQNSDSQVAGTSFITQIGVSKKIQLQKDVDTSLSSKYDIKK